MKNLADSVLARLRNFAKARNLIYNEVLMRYILERIFYRVGASEHAGKLILKGGNLFVFWLNGFDFRPTMDADMLFRGESSPERLKEIFTEICMDESVDDGVRIDIKSIKAEQILEETEYGGIRLSGCRARPRANRAEPPLPPSRDFRADGARRSSRSRECG